MPGMSGTELVPQLLRLQPELRVVVLTGYGSIASAVEAMRLGAHNYVSKPADADDVLAAVTGDARPVATPAGAAAPPPTLARAEWEHIQRILADTGGNVSETARRLGITRRTLQLKLKKYPPASDGPPRPARGRGPGRGQALREARGPGEGKPCGARCDSGSPHRDPGQDRLRSPSLIGTPASGGGIDAGDDVGADDVLPVGDVAVLHQRPGPPSRPLWQGTQVRSIDRLDVRLVGRRIGAGGRRLHRADERGASSVPCRRRSSGRTAIARRRTIPPPAAVRRWDAGARASATS